MLDAEYHESSSHNYSRSGPLLRKHVSPAADKMYSSTQEEIRKLNKDKDLLPRVTAYYVADAINLENAAGFLKRNHRVWCKLYDEVLYVPYQLPLLEGDNGFRVKSNVYKKNSIGQSKLEANIKQSEQRDYHFEYYSGQENEEHKDKKEDEEGDNYAREFKSSNEEDNFDPYEPQYFNYKEQPALVENTVVDHAEVFLYSYGVIVFWNFSKNQEENILADISFYSSDEAGSEMLISKVDEMDFETEEFHVEYDKSAKVPRIFNDLITLKSGDHLIKMTLSHAIAQSTKLCRFESRVQDVLYSVAKLPKILALTGQLGINRQQLLRKSGKLFKLRVDVNLSSNVLDVPEFFWSFEPSLNPLYTGARDYLEIDERVEVINDRCKVFLEFINVISDSIAESNMNKITWIIIVIIAISLLVSCLEIFIRYRIINKE